MRIASNVASAPRARAAAFDVQRVRRDFPSGEAAQARLHGLARLDHLRLFSRDVHPAEGAFIRHLFRFDVLGGEEQFLGVQEGGTVSRDREERQVGRLTYCRMSNRLINGIV